MKLKRIFSFFKIIFLAILHVLISPVFLFLPKYKAYVFVLTTGRSGSGSLSNLLKNSEYVNSYHEPFPILNNNFNLKQKTFELWVWFVFYFVKFPRILLSRKKGNKVYLETNHLFLKSYSSYALKVFKNKIRIVHLRRNPELVAKSIYEIGKIPGSKLGNRWYLNPSGQNNKLDYKQIFQSIKDPQKQNFTELYKCLWYWYEMEKRISSFKMKHNVKILCLKTEDLTCSNYIIDEFNKRFGFIIPEIKDYHSKVDKNLKKGEKNNFLELDTILEKNRLFKNTLTLNNNY